jgi:CheY-like chemotaxis protein
MRILFVDDDAATRSLMAGLLRAEGFQVDACTNPREALELLQTQLHDLLITDYAMTSMNGVELVRLARERTKRPRFPCIVISGLPKPPDAPPTLPWLPKPVELGQLLGAMTLA